MFTLEQLDQILNRLAITPNLCVAYSGGLDSQVLIHSLVSLNQRYNNPFTIRAVHVHHGLSPNADAWAQYCLRSCEALNIPLVVYRARVILEDRSPEDAARVARYTAFKELLQKKEILLTAHTATDQAETLLLQLLRGAGPKGLAAMPEKTTFAGSYLVRPLLTFTRELLQDYAIANQLTWIDDESNSNTRYDRNYLRHAVLPILKQRWPNVITPLTRAAKHCAEMSELADELAAADLAIIRGEISDTINVKKILSLSENRQRNVIRYWLHQLQLPLPSTVKLQQLIKGLLHSRYDATPIVDWCGVEVRRYQYLLYAMKPLPKHNPHVVIPWDLQQDLVLPNDLGVLRIDDIKSIGTEILQRENITVRFRVGGEKCHLPGRKYSHSLKNLMQEWNVPPWQRNRIPLLYQNNNLIAVIGYCVCNI